MWPESYKIPVSRESEEKLRAYHALLLKWQPTINLVAPSTIEDAWSRHFADSAQVVSMIPAGVKSLADLGCGAGFPGLVIAMMRPEIEIHLVESDERKAQFLRTVSRETNTPVTVHAERIVRIIDQIQPEWVSARALAELRKLLIYVEPWAAREPKFTALFMKGAKADEEIAAARKLHDFIVESVASVTDSQAKILKISNIEVKRGR